MEALQKTNGEEAWGSHLQGLYPLFVEVLGMRPMFEIKDMPKCLAG